MKKHLTLPNPLVIAHRGYSAAYPENTISAYANGDLPVTLHVTHSWGGGVAQWVESFIGADDAGVNLQLRSEGPQTGEGCGQRYSLYLGNRLETPIARWWLRRANSSCAWRLTSNSSATFSAVIPMPI